MRLFPNVHRRRAQLLEDFRGKKILDVGCGRKKLAGSIGMDRWVEDSSAAELKPEIVHDLLKFPWPIADHSFDLVHCSHVLEHLPPTAAVMEEIHRILKPGGQLFTESPHFSYVEAYRHHEHCHFFALGTFDFFCNHPGHYKGNFRMLQRELFFNDGLYALGIGFLANWFPRVYERHFAFIFPGSSFYVLLEAVK